MCIRDRCNSAQVGAPAAPLWPSRPVGGGIPPPQRLAGAPLGADPEWAPHYGRRCFYRATWGAAKPQSMS
eukprot:11446548-Alexandrium_andersonii.AAC.1